MAVRRKEETKKAVGRDGGMDGFSVPPYLLFQYLIFGGEVRDVKRKVFSTMKKLVASEVPLFTKIF